MNKLPLSQAFLRKRKMMLVLPALVLPFLTMAFWALGGGRAAGQPAISNNKNKGLNLELPEAHLKDDKPLDKLSYYQKATTDSTEKKEWLQDPDLLGMEKSSTIPFLNNNGTRPFTNLNPSPYNFKSDPSEERLYSQIDKLNRELEKTTVPETLTGALSNTYNKPASPVLRTSEMDRMENMMQQMSPSDSSSDPELKQLNSMLDKIAAIQHPESVQPAAKTSPSKDRTMIYSVRKNRGEDTVVNGFYGTVEQDIITPTDQPALEAVVNENQKLVTGAVIKLRLLQDVSINGSVIPKNSFVFGLSSINNERLEIAIHSIRSGNAILAVNLEVYDMDGLPGIYIPGTITRDAAKQSAEQGVNTLGITSLDPSVGAQAAGAGIQAAKSILGKKAKLVSVMVKAGYRVLLKNSLP